MKTCCRISRKQLILFLAAICLLALPVSCRIKRVIASRLTLSDGQIASSFANAPEKPTVHYYEADGRRMRYLTIGADSLPPLLLLHGSPGSWSSWDDEFLDSSIYLDVRIIAPDRPGYGYSDYGRSYTSIKDEAAFLQKFIDSIAPTGPITIGGSSYGGSVAVQVAINNADRLRGLVLISASTAPGQEKVYGITPFILNNNLRGLVPRLLRMPNDEKLAHYKSLSGISGWEKIRARVYVIHGQADKLVFFSNALYTQRKLRNARVTLVRIPGAGHDINWKRPDTVKHYLRLAISPER